jgi:prepilin-type N-terminal cleavage/methylation domain-containing protein
MNRKGFSLVELVVIVSIMSILLGLATIGFHRWTLQRGIEREVKALHADLLFFRQQAMVRGMRHRVQFPTANLAVFRRYSSEADLAGTEVRRRTMSYNLSRSSWTNPSSSEIEFNSRGMMPDPTAKTLCFYSDASPTVDALYLTTTKNNIAKIKDQGNACGKANIDFK